MASAELLRALDEANVGSILMQPEVDKVVAQLVEYLNPLRQNFPRRRGSGQNWIVNRRAPGSTPAVFIADTDSLTEDTGTYTQVSFAYKTLATRGKVTRKAQATGRSYANILADEMEAKAQDMRDKEDHALLWGQAVAGTPIAGLGSTNEFDGLNALCTSSTTVGVTTAITGGALTTELLDQSIDVVRGDPNMIICSYAGRRKINALLQSQQRFVDSIEVKGGFKVMAYNNIPVFTCTNLPDTLTYDGSDITALTGTTNTTAIYFVDTRKVHIGELTPVTMQPLAKSTSQFDEFDIFEDTTLVARDAEAISKLVGIAV